jgi:hypothetical protein
LILQLEISKVNEMINKRKQKGLALISTIVISTVLLLIAAVMLFRIQANSKEVIRKQNLDKSLQFSEAAIQTALLKMTDLSLADNTAANAGRLTALELAQKFNATDWLDAADNTKFKALSGTNYVKGILYSDPFIVSLNTNANHSQLMFDFFQSTNNFLKEPYINTTPNTYNNLGLKLGLDADFKIENLYNKTFKVYRLNDDKFQGDFKISVVPLRTNIKGKNDVDLHGGGSAGTGEIIAHYDIYKIRSIAYIPNIDNPLVTKMIDYSINRPVKIGPGQNFNFDQAILADGNVDLGNKDTSSGLTATTIDAEQAGDVHSNGNLIFGANGKVNGKATAGGTIKINAGMVPSTDYDATVSSDPRFITDQVTNKAGTKSGVDAIPIPEFNTTGLPTAACPAPGNGVIFKDCKVTGDLDIKGNIDVQFQGTVYITGNLTQSGSSNLNATGTSPVRVVVGDNSTAGSGIIDIGGSTNDNNTREILFISQALSGSQAVKIHGNPGTNGANGAVFAVVNSGTTAALDGNIGFFGALITKGSVNSVGNSGGIKRDSDLSGLKQFVVPRPVRSGFRPEIVSWLEVKN